MTMAAAGATGIVPVRGDMLFGNAIICDGRKFCLLKGHRGLIAL